jgi:2-polyprenyl-6-methoxyphenol hydroxylase-like FAD-dependent oxidoreductase
LVGDAGYQKDPGTAQGITDALSHAELLAEAIDAGLSGRRDITEALADYEQIRNAHARPMYQLTCQLATLAPPTPDMEQIYASLAADPARAQRFLGVFAGSVAVSELFPAPEAIT